MNVDVPLLAAAGAAGTAGVLAAWAATLPALRVKDLRPKAPRTAPDRLQGDHAGPVRAVLGHARCGACRHDCTPRDVAPVVGWRRACPSCGSPQPRFAAALQLGAAVTSVVTVLAFPNVWAAVPVLWLGLVLVAVAVVDARSWVIPRRLIWTGAGVGLALITVSSCAVGEPGYVRTAVVTALVTGACFFVLSVAFRGLGFSDVRLSVLLGLYLGWVGGSYGSESAVR
ncbi:MAG: prepilin peptidase, partial [Actinomycetes bacterium]